MIGLIVSFIARNWMAQLAAALLIAWVALKGWGAIKYQLGWTQGRWDLSEDINRQGSELAKQVEEAQKPADLPGSVDRLVKQWCRDCK